MTKITLVELEWSLKLMKANKSDAVFLYIDKYKTRDEMIIIFENAIKRIKQ